MNRSATRKTECVPLLYILIDLTKTSITEKAHVLSIGITRLCAINVSSSCKSPLQGSSHHLQRIQNSCQTRKTVSSNNKNLFPKLFQHPRHITAQLSKTGTKFHFFESLDYIISCWQKMDIQNNYWIKLDLDAKHTGLIVIEDGRVIFYMQIEYRSGQVVKNLME